MRQITQIKQIKQITRMKRITQIGLVLLLLLPGAFCFGQAGFGVTVNDTTILVTRDGNPLLHYRHALLPPPEGQGEKWARNGFIHPLYSPSGEVLTWAQPPDHLHHLGLWNPWTKVSWKMDDGTLIHTDFWNLGSEEGTVRFREVKDTFSEAGSAGFKVLQDHMAFVPPRDSKENRKEIQVLSEEWIVTISPHPKGYLLDFTSLITNTTRFPVSLDAYRYGGGLGYRATGEWNNTNSYVLTSEGKTWENGDATRARWCMVGGDLKRKNTGLLFMSHPTNYDFPQPMRIWPNDSNGVGHQYFEFTPIRDNSWILEPGKMYSQRYQILVFEGELSAEDADIQWNIYAGNPKIRLLVYTHNGEGYVHDNIQASVDMLKGIAKEMAWEINVTDDPAVFSVQELPKYQAVIFSNTNNEAFANDEQRAAFKKYINLGGGFVGIHSACGSEREWPWFWDMLGGKFIRHPAYQKFSIKVLDSLNPSTRHLGAQWDWEDEAYYLDHLNPDIHVLLAHDLSTIEDPEKEKFPGTVFGDLFPSAWCHTFDGGREWYTSYGHQIKDYEDPNFINHVKGGILWVLSNY